MTTPQVGQTVLFRISSTRTVPAVVSLVIDDDTINLDGFIDTSDNWPISGIPVAHPCEWYGAVVRGTDVGEWQETSANVGATGATGAAGTTGSTGATGAGAVITSSSFVSTSFTGTPPTSSARQPNASHDVLITASFSIVNTLTLSGGTGGTIKLLSDSSNPPTTEICRVSKSDTGTVVVGINLTPSGTMEIYSRIKTGDFYRFVSVNDTGTPTMTLPSGTVFEQVLG